jgi:Tol biopolymer transport system component
MIVAPLGAGGMGEVYRARDSRLDRDVAIKVLPPAFAADPIARARFEREAKAIAALSHPNILAIHEFGGHEGTAYSVTELLEGETLRARLTAGAMPSRKAIEFSVQIARGLAAAHDRGIVHRDLKPENLFVTADGRAKILDFGLARVAASQAEAAAAAVPTMIQTDPNLVMGTVGYMSPEQVRGLDVDSRSDLFAFGAVLYEILSGRRAFQRDTPAETMTAILKEDPPELVAAIGDLPPALDRIVRRCLEKSPTERFQSARDLAFALENLTGSTASTGARAAHTGAAAPRGRALGWAALAILALAAGAAAGWWAHARLETAPPSTGTLAQLTDFPGIERSPSLSADGKTVVYASNASGNFDIYSLRVGGRNPIDLTADSPDGDVMPALSPAGDQIAFRSERSGGGIFVMGATGESIRRLTDFGYDPSWSPDGKELVVSSIGASSPFERSGIGKLVVVTMATGARRTLDIASDAMQPSWSPHGHRIAFWGVERATGRRDLWTIAADGSGPALRATEDAAVDWNPVWAPDGGQLYFVSDRAGVMNLWRIAIDERSGRPLGAPAPVSVPTSYIDGFSIAKDGRLIFAATDRRSTLRRLDFDPQREAVTGDPVTLLQSPRTFRALDWSPDGQMLVFSNFGSTDNLYLVRADGTGYRQLTDDGSRNRGPRWYADGLRILFYSNRGGTYQAWTIKPDGGAPQQITNLRSGVILPIRSPHGDRLAFTQSMSSQWVMAEPRSPGDERVIEVPPNPDRVNTMNPSSWSPDGSRIALFELLPGVADPKMYVYDLSTKTYSRLPAAGASPAWLPDGRRLLFSTRRGVSLIDAATGRTRDVFTHAAQQATPSFGFALSADGRRIALLVLDEQTDLWMVSSR